jgi:hypothetical protein
MALLESPVLAVRSLVRRVRQKHSVTRPTTTSPLKQYTHEPLNHPDAEIRLLLLQPGSYDDDICISFQIRRLKVRHFTDYEKFHRCLC